eukprot:m51a1_g282 putative proteasome chain protein (211) ;mRNA; r:323101-323733
MDSVIAIAGDDWVAMAADATASFSILLLTSSVDRVYAVGGGCLLACQGDEADRVRFCEYVERNLALHRLRTAAPLSPYAAARWVRDELATAIRRAPMTCNVLVGGVGADARAALYYVDYLGAMQGVRYAAHGYGSTFATGLLDRHWRAGMSRAEGVELLRRACLEVQQRIVINAPRYVVKSVGTDGKVAVADPVEMAPPAGIQRTLPLGN